MYPEFLYEVVVIFDQLQLRLYDVSSYKITQIKFKLVP